MKTINKDKLNRTTMFLNDLRLLTLKNKGIVDNKEKQEIHNRYSLPYSMFKISRDLGYFTKVGNKQYVCSVNLFEPFHSRKLIELHLKHHYESNKRWVEKQEKQVKQKPITQVKKETKKNTIIKSKKQFSLFWGLIKFNY